MTHTMADIINAHFSDAQLQAYKVLRKAKQNIDEIKLAKLFTDLQQFTMLEMFVSEHKSFTEEDIVALTTQTLESQAVQTLVSHKIPEHVAAACVKSLDKTAVEAIVFEGKYGSDDNFFGFSGTSCADAINKSTAPTPQQATIQNVSPASDESSDILKDIRNAAQCKTKNECTKAAEILKDHSIDIAADITLQDRDHVQQQITEALTLVEGRLSLIQQKAKIAADISDAGKCKAKSNCESTKAKLDQYYIDVTTDSKFQDPIFDGMQEKLSKALTALSDKLSRLEGSEHKEMLGKLREELSKITSTTHLYSDDQNDEKARDYTKQLSDCRACKPYHENVAKCKEYYSRPSKCLDHNIKMEAMPCAIYSGIKISCPTFESNPAGCKKYNETQHEACIKMPERCENNTCRTDSDKTKIEQLVKNVRIDIAAKTEAKSALKHFAELYAVDSHSVIDELPNLTRQFQKDYCNAYSCGTKDKSALNSQLEAFSTAIKSCGDVQHPCDDLFA